MFCSAAVANCIQQFESDYLEFNQHTLELAEDLKHWINATLDGIDDTKRALVTLKRFQNIFQHENLRVRFLGSILIFAAHFVKA